MLKTWQNITLWKRVLVGLVLGLAVGLAVRYGLPPQELTKKITVGVVEPGTESTLETDYETEAGRIAIFDLAKGGQFSSNAVFNRVDSDNGSATINDGKIEFKPNDQFTGVETISVSATEPFGNSMLLPRNGSNHSVICLFD